MTSAADLPDTLPIFPLPGALLLPRGTLPLHIFEPRYLAMIEDALKSGHRLIGMIQPIDAPEPDTVPRLRAIGCAGRISAFSEVPGGRFMITLSGVSRFRVARVEEGFTPYLRVAARWTDFGADLGRAETDKGFDRDAFLGLLGRFLDLAELKTDWDALKAAEDELLINSLSMLCPFDPGDKQALLEAPTLADRRETLIALIEFAMRAGDEEGPLQ